MIAPAPRLRDLVRADLAEMAKVKGTAWPSARGLVDVLGLPGTWCTVLWRLANALHHAGLRPLSRLVYFANVVLFSAELHPGATVGPGVVIPHPVGVCIAGDVVIGARVRLLRGAGIGGNGNPHQSGHPVIGDDVWLMDGARVFGPVHVGDRAIIGTGALCADDVPADMFLFGVRASRDMRPLADLDLADHGGSLTDRTPDGRPVALDEVRSARRAG